MGCPRNPPRRLSLNFCWQASQTVTFALVSSRRNGRSRQFISVFTMNLAHFLARACLGLPRPAVSQMAPRWLSMAPRCLPYVSQMYPRCLPDVSQRSPRCLAGGSQISPRCHPDVSRMSLTDISPRWFSQMSPRYVSDISQMSLRCLSDVS